MTKHKSAFSRREAPESCMHSSPNRAWGMPGAQCTRSLACENKKHTSVVTTGPLGSPGIPTRNGFNDFLRALLGDRACLPPSPSELPPRDLTPASGRQDHTTSSSARPRSRQQRRPRPSHPAPTSVTIAKRPFKRAGRRAYVADLAQPGSGIFFRP
jgi:hypothetical protein